MKFRAKGIKTKKCHHRQPFEVVDHGLCCQPRDKQTQDGGQDQLHHNGVED